jgi:dihydroxy-acid dehydratase
MDPRKDEVAFRCGEVVLNLLEKGIKPSDILTREAFENAIAGVATTGGSTNAVLHLLAISREIGLALDIDNFQRVSERTPLLADLKPAGKYVAADVDGAGGIPVIAKRLLGS